MFDLKVVGSKISRLLFPPERFTQYNALRCWTDFLVETEQKVGGLHIHEAVSADVGLAAGLPADCLHLTVELLLLLQPGRELSLLLA